MDIKHVINAMNAHQHIFLMVYNCYGDRCLYIGEYEKMAEKMFTWEVQSFYIDELANFDGMKRVTKARIYIEYMQEYK